MIKTISQICDRAFASPRAGTLSSKRIGAAFLITSAIIKGFLVIGAWIAFQVAALVIARHNPQIGNQNLSLNIPIEIVWLILSELFFGSLLLGLTLAEKSFKVLTDAIGDKIGKIKKLSNV